MTPKEHVLLIHVKVLLKFSKLTEPARAVRTTPVLMIPRELVSQILAQLKHRFYK